MQIIQKELGEIRPYPGNPRINDEAVDPVAESIREFGFKVPIVIDRTGEIINGHTRYKAAQKLNLKSVPVIVADDLSEEQIKAFRLADNKTSEIAQWDLELLFDEMSEITDLDMTLFGFEESDYSLDDISEETESETADGDEIEKAEAEFVSLGDVYQLGRHRLMCGDSTNLDDMSALIDGQEIDLYVTDPPYNVAYEGGTEEAMTILNDSMDDASFRQFLKDSFKVADEFLKPGGVFYIWHADSEGLNFRAAVKETGWLLKQNLVWVKNSIVLGRQDYQWKHEPCLYGWKDGGPHYFVDNRALASVIEEDEDNLKEMTKSELISYIKTMQEESPSTVFFEDKPVRNDIHPTMKPLKLIARCVLNSSKKGDKVLDSFNGGGSTLIVCEQTERTCFAMELDPLYVERTIKRWEDLTGEKAEKIE
ncbi:DNA modification methylase [Streptococcus danieliae]|uniref:DNA modification methylase n=1 Tax=Streptococcus danieliae TaxID=747656 RepID=UPI0021C8F104|nr:DNA modification methylase [Streptococcus danieliae]MCU0081865.1 DNA modification methylase [Streptococcus danieliae]